MSHPLYPGGIPRFNHIALSLTPDQLDENGRAEIISFHSDVFGFEEISQMTLDRRRLVLSCCHHEQFIFLVSEETPMVAPRLDHVGLSVPRLDDLLAAHDRAASWAMNDDRVDLIAPSVDAHEVVRIHSFYVRFLLPVMIEIQHWEFT